MILTTSAIGLLAGAVLPALSSHREAPQITELPKVDATDFYMFRSYEPGKEDHTILIANYVPLQDPYGGPNYFTMDPEGLYEIHVDNNGDAAEDITFQFRFKQDLADIALQVGSAGAEKTVSIPLVNVGQIAAGDTSNANVTERYTCTVVFGDRRTGTAFAVTNAIGGATEFAKPVDYIGQKTFPDYEAYAAAHVHSIALPGGFTGRMFVGQRKDPFVVNLGETFDLVNLNPLGPVDGEADTLADKNVTSLILEVPTAFLVVDAPVIGAWTTASLRQARVMNPSPTGAGTAAVQGGAYTQVSRLAMPLVNEVVIGLKDKDAFNHSEPNGDAQFLDYVTNPTLPEILQVLFGVQAPELFPRQDLVQIFLTGVPGLNENGSTAEMMRLNTEVAVTAFASQNNLGVIGGDLGGYPNGRRPGDDVVDISLRAVMGVLLDASVAPDGQLAYTDGALVDASHFGVAFPFLATPIPGSPSY
jgi:hypothetical protein